MNTTINIRIDKETKTKVKKMLGDMGLDLSSGIKLFLNQVVTEQGIPFTPTRNTAKIRAHWDKEVVETIKNNQRYKATKDMMDDILK